MASAKILIEVTAGLIPGQAEEKHHRIWAITSEEWEVACATAPSDQGEAVRALLKERGETADAYARDLQHLSAAGYEVNWTRIDWVYL